MSPSSPQSVGMIAWIQESNTFLGQPTTLADYESHLLLLGPAAARLAADPHHEYAGFQDGLLAANLTPCPIFAARALPAGALSTSAEIELLRRLASEVERVLPDVAGFLAAPHGANVGEQFPDLDGCWLGWLRERAGQRPIIAAIDPHANLSPAMIQATDAITAYRTNPHIDQRARGLEAADLMARTLRGEIRPTQAACFPPMAINIERQCTEEEPIAGLYRLADEIRSRPGVLSASIVLGFPYSDVAEMGSATIVVTDNDPALAQQLADELGAAMWELREPLAGHLIDVSTALDLAAALPGPVCLLDMGDNVGGGSPADGTVIATALHERKQGPSFVCLFDPAAVQSCQAAGVGQRLSLSLGAHSDQRHGAPLDVTVEVLKLVDGKFRESEPRHGGFSEFDQGLTAIVRTDSQLTVMLTSRRMVPFSTSQLTTFGLQPQDFRYIVAKGVNAPLAAYRPVCPSIVRVNTPGVTTADMTTLNYQHRRRPLYPWEPADFATRGWQSP